MTGPPSQCLVTFIAKRNDFSQYYSCKERWMSLITEKKVEIWHSVLRAATQLTTLQIT